MVPTPTQLRNMPPPPLSAIPPTRRLKPWSAVDRGSMRMGYELTPERVWWALREAEGGNPAAQCDLFEDVLETDGHMRGQYLSRVSAVALRPWTLRPGGPDDLSVRAAEELLRALRRCNMLDLLWHLMDATFFGYSPANTVWRFTEKTRTVDPTWFIIAAHRRFLVDDRDRLRIRDEDMAWPGNELREGEWIVAARHHRKIVRAGLMRTAVWWALFKRLSLRDWIVFAEKFGLPVVLGYYQERASPESREALEQAITDIGSDGQAVLSELTKLVIESAQVRAGDVTSLHPQIVAVCNAEISKLFTGATLNTETGGPGSFALGKVHENRSTSLSYSDLYWLQDVFNRGLVMPWLAYNPQFESAEPPCLAVHVQPEADPLTQVQVDEKLQKMGLELDPEQMYETYARRRPKAGNALVSEATRKVEADASKAEQASDPANRPE